MVCEVLIEMLYLLDKTERTSGKGLIFVPSLGLGM